MWRLQAWTFSQTECQAKQVKSRYNAGTACCFHTRASVWNTAEFLVSLVHTCLQKTKRTIQTKKLFNTWTHTDRQTDGETDSVIPLHFAAGRRIKTITLINGRDTTCCFRCRNNSWRSRNRKEQKRERERERNRQTDRERKRDTHTDRNRERETHTHTLSLSHTHKQKLVEETFNSSKISAVA